MVSHDRAQRGLIGFITGLAIGCGLNYLGLLLNNWLCQWSREEPVVIIVWKVLPLWLLLGMIIAINMAHPPFGD